MDITLILIVSYSATWKIPGESRSAFQKRTLGNQNVVNFYSFLFWTEQYCFPHYFYWKMVVNLKYRMQPWIPYLMYYSWTAGPLESQNKIWLLSQKTPKWICAASEVALWNQVPCASNLSLCPQSFGRCWGSRSYFSKGPWSHSGDVWLLE